MMKTSALFFVCVSVFALVSCRTILNNGISGSEHAALPPYQITEEPHVDIAVSAEAGGTGTSSPGKESMNSNFAKGSAILQWQNLLDSNRLCGSASISGWGGKIVEHADEDEAFMPSYRDSIFYGGTTALRVGCRLFSAGRKIYVPSVEILYSYEGGPYIDSRRDLEDIKINDKDQFVNLKPNHSSFMVSVIPVDFTFSLFHGEMRLVNSYGWTDQASEAYDQRKRRNDEMDDDEDKNDWGMILPMQYEFSMTYKPSFCDAYITMNLNFLNQYHDDDSGFTSGFSIGLGYVFR